MYAYHVVTDRPLSVGQQILFDQEHHSGVFRRVQAKLPVVNDIYANPDQYRDLKPEHHTAVALRELALEEIRLREYPRYPSRMHCLYVSETVEEAAQWAEYFVGLGRPTYCIVKLKVDGNCFKGDASKCFVGQTDHAENLRLARLYWENSTAPDQSPVREVLVDGKITVLEIVKEINANLPSGR